MKILICTNNYRQGGVSRTLQFFLKQMGEAGYDIDLFCLDPHGPYKGTYSGCTILPTDKWISMLLCYRKESSLASLLLKLCRRLGEKLFGKDILDVFYTRRAKKLQGRYDVAFAWSEGYADLLVQRMDGPLKLARIHNDYSFDPPTHGADFSRFDNIICVSHASSRSFIELFPALKDKVRVIHNLLDAQGVRKQAEVSIDDAAFMRSGKTIVSVGRIDYPKHFDVIPQIAAGLKERGIVFRWFIIGGGQGILKQEVEDNIVRYSVQDEVVLLGNRNNPYPYIAAADVYVLTSRFDCYPTVVNEALLLGKPVVSSEIPVAAEMVAPENGSIVSYDKMADVIADLLNNPVIPEFKDHTEDTIEKYQLLFESKL
ncbi:MAG: glycosyltransferase [Bacteroidales bacterium]|nr:glycosyltransferase [Bacteroidales bacterium]